MPFDAHTVADPMTDGISQPGIPYGVQGELVHPGARPAALKGVNRSSTGFGHRSHDPKLLCTYLPQDQSRTTLGMISTQAASNSSHYGFSRQGLAGRNSAVG